MSKKCIVNEGGILGFESTSEKISFQEFDLIKMEVNKLIEKRTPEQNLRNKLISLKYKMEEYRETNNPENIVAVGKFIEEFLKMIQIKSKDFAEFIEVSKYDLSKIINSKKKLNNDLALKLGYLFNVKPDLWIDIQNKNELIMLEKEDSNKYKKYCLEDLLAKK